MAKWTREEINDQVAILEHGFTINEWAFYGSLDGNVYIYIESGKREAVALRQSMIDLLMNSTCFDRDFYSVLVDIFNIDAEVAARMCLDG